MNFIDHKTRQRLAQIELLLLDCDGVLTDGQVLVDPNGVEAKRFSLRDGHGISLARNAGLQVAIITRLPSASLSARARKLGVKHVLAAMDKAQAVRSLCTEVGIAPARAAFVGDDVFDIPAMDEVGVAVAVADAHERVIARADLVTQARGGHGAVREIIDRILEQRNAALEIDTVGQPAVPASAQGSLAMGQQPSGPLVTPGGSEVAQRVAQRSVRTSSQERIPSSPIGQVVQRGTYIVAEIGQNHQGDPALARELIRTAKICGVNAVKSQKRDIQTLLSPEEYHKPYESPHAFGKTYGEHREALELSREAWADLFAFAAEIGIDFFASPWDIPSARLLAELHCPIYKIPSAAVTNLPLLQEIATYGRPVILSTGMSAMHEIDTAVSILKRTELYLLQCTSAYPVEFSDVNLRAMKTLADRYGEVVGLSGHHKGIAVDVAATALGARLLERHFTLDRTWKGTDHAASLEPPGLSRLVRDVRAVEAALGDGQKSIRECELKARAKLRGPVQLVSQQAAG